MSRIQNTQRLQQAEAAYQSGKWDVAINLCEEVLGHDSNNDLALHILGAAAIELGRFERAAESLEKCARTKSNDSTVLFRLAQARVGQAKYDEAIKCFNRVLKLDPGYPFALAAKLDTLERAGMRDEARELLKPYLDSNTQDPHMALIHAKLLRSENENTKAIEVVNTALASNNMQPATQWQLLFLKGWCLEKLDDIDGAFESFQSANGVIPSSFDVDAYERELDHVMEVFTHDLISGILGVPSNSTVPVFVVGMPRSGSTLVEQILAAHPKVAGAGEIGAMYEVLVSSSKVLKSTLPYPDCFLDVKIAGLGRLAQKYLKQLTSGRRRADRVVDKLLRNFEYLGLIALLFPNARVINCLRDPVDTCLSCYMQPLSPTEHGYANNLASLGRVHCLYERVMKHWHNTLDLKIMDIQYEELVADQERISRQMIDFCDLKWDESCLQFYKSGRSVQTLSYDQVRRPIYKSALMRHEKYVKHIDPLIDALEKYSSA